MGLDADELLMVPTMEEDVANITKCKQKWAFASDLIAKSKYNYFSSFLPRRAVKMLQFRSLKLSDEQSFVQKAESVILIVDISGFTKLCDRFQAYGQEGIDALSLNVNMIFNEILNHVEHWGGDVVRFVGDALLVMWESDENSLRSTLARVLECAVQLEERHGSFLVKLPNVKKKAVVDNLVVHSSTISNNDRMTESGMLEIRRILRNQPGFKCLNDHEISLLVSKSDFVNFKADDVFFRKGDVGGDCMYIIQSGEAKICVLPTIADSGLLSENMESSFFWASAGDTIGETAVLTGQRHTTTFIAAEPCSAIRIPSAALAPLFRSNAKLREGLLRPLNTNGVGRETALEDQIRLRVHQSIACGGVWLAHIGGAHVEGLLPNHGPTCRREFVVLGPPILRAGEALAEAPPGGIVIAAAAWDHAQDKYTATRTPCGNFLLTVSAAAPRTAKSIATAAKAIESLLASKDGNSDSSGHVDACGGIGGGCACRIQIRVGDGGDGVATCSANLHAASFTIGPSFDISLIPAVFEGGRDKNLGEKEISIDGTDYVTSPQRGRLGVTNGKQDVIMDGETDVTKGRNSGCEKEVVRPGLGEKKAAGLWTQLRNYCHEGARDLQEVADFSAEIRQVTVLFFMLHVDLESDDDGAARAAHTAMLTLQRAVYRRRGTIQKLVQDDKGLVAVCVMGMPPHAPHEGDATRGVLAALDARAALATAAGLRCSIGIATGGAYSGFVGGARRREMCVMGSTVNMAARLMCAAAEEYSAARNSVATGPDGGAGGVAGGRREGGRGGGCGMGGDDGGDLGGGGRNGDRESWGRILVDRQTLERTSLSIIFQEHQPVRVKGRDDPIEVFEPSRQRRSGDELRGAVFDFVRRRFGVTRMAQPVEAYFDDMSRMGEEWCSPAYLADVCSYVHEHGQVVVSDPSAGTTPASPSITPTPSTPSLPLHGEGSEVPLSPPSVGRDAGGQKVAAFAGLVAASSTATVGKAGAAQDDAKQGSESGPVLIAAAGGQLELEDIRPSTGMTLRRLGCEVLEFPRPSMPPGPVQMLTKVACCMSHRGFFPSALVRHVFCASFPAFAALYDDALATLAGDGTVRPAGAADMCRCFQEDDDIAAEDSDVVSALWGWTRGRLRWDLYAQMLGFKAASNTHLACNIVLATGVVINRSDHDGGSGDDGGTRSLPQSPAAAAMSLSSSPLAETAAAQELSVSIEATAMATAELPPGGGAGGDRECGRRIPLQTVTANDLSPAFRDYLEGHAGGKHDHPPVYYFVAADIVESVSRGLLHSHRRVWHRHAAEFYERMLDRRPDAARLILARHWAAAAELRTHQDPATVDAAIRHLHAAARIAVGHDEYAPALELLQRAGTLMDLLPLAAELRVELVAEMAPYALLVRGPGSDEAVSAYHDLGRLTVPPAGPLDCRAVAALAGICANLSAKGLLQPARHVAEDVCARGATEVLRRVGTALCAPLMYQLGDFAAAAAALEELYQATFAKPPVRPAEDRRVRGGGGGAAAVAPGPLVNGVHLAIVALSYWPAALACIQDLPAAAAAADRVVALAEATEHSATICYALALLARHYCNVVGDTLRCAVLAARAEGLAVRHQLVHCREIVAAARARAGEAHGSRGQAQQAFRAGMMGESAGRRKSF